MYAHVRVKKAARIQCRHSLSHVTRASLRVSIGVSVTLAGDGKHAAEQAKVASVQDEVKELEDEVEILKVDGLQEAVEQVIEAKWPSLSGAHRQAASPESGSTFAQLIGATTRLKSKESALQLASA